MTKLKTKIYGVSKEIRLVPSHFLSRALEIFLTSSDILKLIESVTLLSIGMETYIKTLLHDRNPLLIKRLDWNRWDNIKQFFNSTQKKKDQRNIIHQRLLNYSDLNKTLDYGIALEVFPYFYRIPQRIIEDLIEFKNYRNGLFHWKAHDVASLELTRRTMRVFDWLFKLIKKRNGWWLGGEFNLIDPDGSKRQQFYQLKKHFRSEDKLIVQRRIFEHYYNFIIYYQAKARLDKLVYTPDAKVLNEPCPACHYHQIELIESIGMRDGKIESRKLHLHCIRCDFVCTDNEYEIINPKGQPTLRQRFDED